MPKQCLFNGCTYNVFAKKYCRHHQYLRTDKTVKTIQPYSQKRQKENVIYSTLRKVFLSTRPLCQINSPACTHNAICVHHTRGRLKQFFLDVSTWLASCIACNNYVEQHDQWARDNGYKQSKFSPAQSALDQT